LALAAELGADEELIQGMREGLHEIQQNPDEDVDEEIQRPPEVPDLIVDSRMTPLFSDALNEIFSRFDSVQSLRYQSLLTALGRRRCMEYS